MARTKQSARKPLVNARIAILAAAASPKTGKTGKAVVKKGKVKKGKAVAKKGKVKKGRTKAPKVPRMELVGIQEPELATVAELEQIDAELEQIELATVAAPTELEQIEIYTAAAPATAPAADHGGWPATWIPNPRYPADPRKYMPPRP
jgi:hypothetical protein